MSVVLEAPPATLFDSLPASAAPAPAEAAQPAAVRDGGPTLEALVSGAWEGLAARRTVACPLCEEPMEPVFAAGALAVGGRCGSCGTRLD